MCVCFMEKKKSLKMLDECTKDVFLVFILCKMGIKLASVWHSEDKSRVTQCIKWHLW